MIFYSSNQQLHEERMLQRMETTSLRTVLNKECKDESSQGSFCSVSASSSSSPAISLAPGSTTSVLPPVPLGTPISILDFAQLSPSQQKLWMEGNKKNDTPSWRHHQTKAAGCTIINTKDGGDSSASLNSTTSAGSCCSSTTIKSEETIRSLSSGCSTEENEDKGQSCSRRTTSSVGSQQLNKSSAQRSIFAPYWAKTGGKTMLLQRVQESRGVPVVVHGTDDSQTNNKEDNFLRETSSSNKMAMDYHHEMIKNEQAVRLPPPPSCTSTAASTGSNSSSNTPDGGSSPSSPPRRSIFGLETRSPQPRNHKKSICEIPPTLVPRFLHLPEQRPTLLSTNHKKARSTSALLDPPKESILKGEDGDDGPHPRRPRSHSFSVTFDSKVDVVLFHDPPAPYQSSPWWLRLVGGGGDGGNFDFSGSRNCHEQEDVNNKAPQQWRGGPRRVQSQRCSTTTTAIRNCHKSNTANRRLLPCDSF